MPNPHRLYQAHRTQTSCLEFRYHFEGGERFCWKTRYSVQSSRILYKNEARIHDMTAVYDDHSLSSYTNRSIQSSMYKEAPSCAIFIEDRVFHFTRLRLLVLSAQEFKQLLIRKLPQITESTARQIFCNVRRKIYMFERFDRPLPWMETMTISRGSQERPDKLFIQAGQSSKKRRLALLHTASLHVVPMMAESSDNIASLVVSCPELEA